jgi:hypothetical protein
MKKPKTNKAKAKEPKAAGAKTNSVDPEKRAVFLANKDAFAKASEKLKKAQAAVRSLGQDDKIGRLYRQADQTRYPTRDPRGRGRVQGIGRERSPGSSVCRCRDRLSVEYVH